MLEYREEINQKVGIQGRDKLESFDRKNFLTLQFFFKNIINLLEESFKNIIH